MLNKLLGAASLGALTIAGAAGAQTTTATTTGTTTPGVPSTGVGGDAATNALLLGIALLVAFAGALYLYTRDRTRISSDWQ